MGGFLRVGQPKGRILGYLCRYGSDVYTHVFFSYLDAHICMGYGKSDKDERGLLLCERNVHQDGKSKAPVLLWDMARASYISMLHSR
jgi:hypothetical protein